MWSQGDTFNVVQQARFSIVTKSEQYNVRRLPIWDIVKAYLLAEGRWQQP